MKKKFCVLCMLAAAGAVYALLCIAGLSSLGLGAAVGALRAAGK